MWKACLYFLCFIHSFKNKSVMNTCQIMYILVWFYFLRLGNSAMSVKSQYFDQSGSVFFFSPESSQWFECHVKFWCATTCKCHKARKRRDFWTKHFITSARSSKFNSNICKAATSLFSTLFLYQKCLEHHLAECILLNFKINTFGSVNSV